MLLTVREVSERLNVSLGLVYKLIQQGSLRVHRINSSLRISEEQLQEYLTTAAEEPAMVEVGVTTKFL